MYLFRRHDNNQFSQQVFKLICLIEGMQLCSVRKLGIYLEEMHGWISNAKGIYERGHFFTFFTGCHLEMDNGDT